MGNSKIVNPPANSQLALTIFGRAMYRPSIRWYKLWYTINPPFQARQHSFLFLSELEITSRSRLYKDEIAEFLTKAERKTCKNTKEVSHDGCFFTFWAVSATSVYILKQCRPMGQSFEESLRGGMIRYASWMNNKTIIEFSFRAM